MSSISTTEPIRVLVADDHAWVREGLRAALHCPPQIIVMSTAADARELIARVNTESPDVVLLDYAFAQDDGLELATRLGVMCPPERVILITAWENAGAYKVARDAGLGGFLLKKADDNRLRHAVVDVAAGRRFFPEIRSYPEPPAPWGRPRWEALTQTEWKVLRVLVDAGTPKQAAAKMGHGYSPKTMANHLQNIYRKLGRNGFRVVADWYIHEGRRHDPAASPEGTIPGG